MPSCTLWCVGLASWATSTPTAPSPKQPDFSETPLENDEQVNKWLRFYECHAPLTCLSVFISHDPVRRLGSFGPQRLTYFPYPTPQGLQLRMEHTHCFSLHGQGGHYHCDTTPPDVKYTGYFSLAEYVYRVDAPPKKA